METLRNPNISFPVSALVAVIVTGMLLIFNHNLSKIYLPIKIIDHPEPVYIEHTETPETVKTEETEVFANEPLAQTTRNTTPDTTPRPETVVPVPPGNMDGFEKLDIPRFIPGRYVQRPDVPKYFTPEQVEHKPRVLKPVTPIYPYQATVNGIEGRVVLRFIVDENGKVENPVVVKSEPEGVFDEAALAAIVKYKFIPAKIGKKSVKCIAVMPVGFKIN